MPPAWFGRHIQTAAEYQAEFNVLYPHGFRLLDLNGYSINGVDHFATVWEQSPGPSWVAKHDQTSQQHDALFDTLPAQGFRPIAVSGYDKGGEARFASLWQQNGLDVRAKHGMTAAELEAEFNARRVPASVWSISTATPSPGRCASQRFGSARPCRSPWSVTA